VLFGDHETTGMNASTPLDRFYFTSNSHEFYQMLQSISFSGGGTGQAAVLDGIVAALEVCLN
jgi:hypothetical protein